MNVRALLVLLASVALPVRLVAQLPTPSSYRLQGGLWFDGTRFVPKTWYTVAGAFTDQPPARVDSVIDLDGKYLVPPFGDAHSHSWDNPATIAAAIRSNLADGVFYALSLTNSIRGRRAVAGDLNRPTSVDVGYADAGITSTRGHPIMSAEMSANRWPWDSLRSYFPRLLRSRTAEGDVYFVVDSLRDVERQWRRIVASRPDVIKVYLLDTERYETLRRDTTTIGRNGLGPAVVPAIVAAAHRERIRVAAHIETAADFHLAVATGVDIVAHLPGVAIAADADTARFLIVAADARMAAEKGIVVVPTAWLATQERISRGDSAQIVRTRRIQRRNLELLSRAGVPIAVGADLFVNAPIEAEYLRELGVLDNLGVLRSWSETTPRTIFPGRRIGKLSQGFEASFLALDCDPVADLSCTRRIAIRMKQGHLLPGSNPSRADDRYGSTTRRNGEVAPQETASSSNPTTRAP